jgi:hypothetical protein
MHAMNENPRPPRRFWRRLFWFLVWMMAVLVIGVGGLCMYGFRDRNPGYRVALDVDGQMAAASPRLLQAGFARVKINPNLSDPNRPIWLAGFGPHRAATKIHDDLWATACVIDDGYTRLGIVALDAIGFFHDDVIAVRRRLGAQLGLTYTVVCSTHNHSTPDLMGLWGPTYVQTGVDQDYREQVISAAARALADAVDALEPARLAFSHIPLNPAGLETDTRKPIIFDPDLRLMHFTHQVDGSTLGTIISWADHPETPWSHNTEITADFPGYLRNALENGITEKGAVLEPGVGGIHLYINGAIGGLMTTSPSVIVHDPYLNDDFKEPGHQKARALGRQLASRILPVLRKDEEQPTGPDHIAIAIRARTVELPLQNKLFLLAPVLGVIDRGHPGWQQWDRVRSEVALIRIGDASIACIPGEIYPELVNGGVERAPGADFGVDPVEVPPIRAMMPGKIKFIFGLANDEVGYLIPKSEWDEKPPYLYGSPTPLYGEINSLGPDAAAAVHDALGGLCRTETRQLTSEQPHE